MKDKKDIWDSGGREIGTKKDTMPSTENEDLKKGGKRNRMDTEWGKKMAMQQENKVEENEEGICREGKS